MRRGITGLIFVTVLSFFCISACTAEQGPWKPLVKDGSLDGWVKKGGDASYEVKGNTITGKTAVNTPNTFLCTKKSYSDFILKLEFKVNNELNSGVQIRSNSFPEYHNGRVHGYQVEIDPSSRSWTGGIYDEARRGWLYPLAGNPEARKAFKNGQWNKMRVEAIDDNIKVWINDVPTAHLQDDRTKKGFIGLQVHGIGSDKSKKGIEVSWRNIKIIDKDVRRYSQISPLPAKNMYNKLTRQERQQGWKLLFDGQTPQGWRGAELDHFPTTGWIIENGVLTVKESGGGEAAHGGDIVTKKQYSDFELRVDFRITPGANSGIKYFVDTELNKGAGSAIGLEYQILDDELHPDAEKGNHEGSRVLAALYDLIKPENKYPNPVGEWNHARILSKGQHVEHWLNGRKVLEYERGSKHYRKLVSESKYDKWEDFGELPKGNILLQDHGNRVSFRNIKIKKLK